MDLLTQFTLGKKQKDKGCFKIGIYFSTKYVICKRPLFTKFCRHCSVVELGIEPSQD